MIVAILTAYKPDPGFKTRFLPLLEVCEAVIVSDNTPGGHTFSDLPSQFVVLRNGQNLGLGPALNAGLAEARRMEASHAILFDQDSTPSPELVRQIFRMLDRAQTVCGRKCCIGPTHVDDQLGAMTDDRPASDSALQAGHAELQEVTCLPTSGIAIPLDSLASEELFADDLFLDLVDFEWCWRLRKSGWRFLRTPEVRMFHRLGEAERRLFGVRFYVPAPYRHYFQVRDTIRLSFRSYVPFYSKVRLLGVLPIKALLYPLILDHGLERMRWMFRGAIDGLRGSRGMGAAWVRLSK